MNRGLRSGTELPANWFGKSEGDGEIRDSIGRTSIKRKNARINSIKMKNKFINYCINYELGVLRLHTGGANTQAHGDLKRMAVERVCKMNENKLMKNDENGGREGLDGVLRTNNIHI